MDRFVVPPRDDAKRRREVSPRGVGDRGSGPAMTARVGGVPLRKRAITTDTVCGNAKDRPGWAGRPGRRAGMVRQAHQPRPQGMAKRLTLTERRLSFDYVES